MSQTTTVERRILELHFKMTAAELGYYNPKAKKFKEGLESEPLYQTNLQIVRDALKSGWPAAELESFIRERYNAEDRAVLLSDLLPRRREHTVEESTNLIEPGLIYQHPALYDRQAPAYYIQGDMMVMSAPARQTRKETFTLRQLVDYYVQQITGAANPRQFTAAVGSFRYLLQDARVDELLHAVDLGRDYRTETGREVSVLDLQRFLSDARMEVKRREARKSE